MGLYIKVIADYSEEVTDEAVVSRVPKDLTPDRVVVGGSDQRTYFRKDGKVYAEYKTGEELFITGKEQRIYYPRPEHALIEYNDPASNFPRQRYYGIAIPTGKGRYILAKNEGDVKTVEGPQIFLPDPRHQVIIRRVLDAKTVALWYPGNAEALAFNDSIRSLAEGSDNYVYDAAVKAASVDSLRGMNRGLSGSKTLGAVALVRGRQAGPGHAVHPAADAHPEHEVRRRADHQPVRRLRGPDRGQVGQPARRGRAGDDPAQVRRVAGGPRTFAPASRRRPTS